MHIKFDFKRRLIFSISNKRGAASTLMS